MTSHCANKASFVKVGGLAEFVNALVAYWLGTLPKDAGGNPSESMTNYFHMYNDCRLLFIYN